jgi:hypothetical protein
MHRGGHRLADTFVLILPDPRYSPHIVPSPRLL